MLDITADHRDFRGSLTARLDGQPVGHIDFIPSGPGVVDLNHTLVFPAFEGRGFGRQLVAAAVAFARAEGLKLEASCPYAAQVIARRSDWADVWDKS